MAGGSQTSVFYANALSTGGGSNNGFGILNGIGAPDGVYAEVMGGYTYSGDTAFQYSTFNGGSVVDDIIPKFSVITAVALETHTLSRNDGKTGGPTTTSWLYTSPHGGNTLGSFSIPASNNTYDHGVLSYDITPSGPWTRDDVSGLFVGNFGQGSSASLTQAQAYWDYWKLTVTWIHPAEQRMVI